MREILQLQPELNLPFLLKIEVDKHSNILCRINLDNDKVTSFSYTSAQYLKRTNNIFLAETFRYKVQA